MIKRIQQLVLICIRKIYAKPLNVGVSLRFQKIIRIECRPGLSRLLLILPVLIFLPVHGLFAEQLLEIAPGIFLRPGLHEDFSASNRGHIANIGFIVGNESVAVIDTGSNYLEGEALRKMIKKVTDLPIEYVILTHMHPDHVLGAAAFSQDNPVFIGHAQLEDALVRRHSIYINNMKQILGDSAKDTRIIFPDQSVSRTQGMEIDLGSRRLLLTAYPTAHTNNDLSIYDTKTATLWLSDLLFVERIPVVDGSLLGWLNVIDDLLASNCFTHIDKNNTQGDVEEQRCHEIERVVPGHGSVVNDWQNVLINQRRYLSRIASQVREVIKAGGTITQAVKRVGLEEQSHWLLFKTYHGRNVTAAFAELEWE
jgi:quinoprotein relay system zinc metallohydrolase 2